MAMAYPEGEVFFARSGLATPQPNGYRAENMSHFHSHIMVEYIWNLPADHASQAANSPHGHTHPRSGYRIVRGSWWNTDYGTWTHLPFSYGPTEGNIQRRVQHNLCVNGNIFRDQERGAAVQVKFMTMPMPTSAERWVWIDMLAFIRAIYIPVAWSADANYPHISTWVQINFAVNGTRSIWRGGNQFLNHTTNVTRGLGVHRNSTLGLDITGLTQLLCVPRAMRNVNVYSGRFVKISNRTSLRTNPLLHTFSEEYDFDWTTVARANFGLDLMWSTGQRGFWIENFLRNVLTIAVGFVPLVGPLLAIAFPLAWTAIVNPDDFMTELRNLAPGVDLTLRVIEEIKSSAANTRSVIHPNMLRSMAAPQVRDHVIRQLSSLEEVGRSPLFIEAGKVLEESGSAEPKYEEGYNDPGEVIAEIQPAEDD